MRAAEACRPSGDGSSIHTDRKRWTAMGGLLWTIFAIIGIIVVIGWIF
jgi:hypothetical protein